MEQTPYDPLVFYDPVSVRGKILLQDLNREKIPFHLELLEQGVNGRK
jgi:hypothetical protein